MLASLLTFSLLSCPVIASQIYFFQSEVMQNWTFELCREWDVLGPFPIHAREQHFLSPSFPLDLSVPYDHEPNRTWSSSYADGGQVGWSTQIATDDGRLLVSFPHIRWDTLRATEGWAALQHHSVLHTTLKLLPPNPPNEFYSSPPRLALSLLRASFFTLIPASHISANISYTPEWHPANIYALSRPPKQFVDLPNLSPTKPTTYHLFVSGDYEIRLFGDPTVTGRKDPVLDININVELEPCRDLFVLQPTLDVSCDFVDGWAFGNALGVGLYATDGWWDILSVTSTASNLSVLLKHPLRLAPLQTRVVPLQIDQKGPFHGDVVNFNILLFNPVASRSFSLEVSLGIRHRSLWHSQEYKALKATYFLADTPTPFVALPPCKTNTSAPKAPILALHGAGVDIANAFWSASLPRQQNSWIICPAGRTSWGFDWHGPSTDDAWGSLAGLANILATNPGWHPWRIQADARAVIIGHSNGGQGTWYLASRYPDRVLAAIPAAAFIKAQQYVPVHLSRGSHFVDPFLRALLDASLTPDDNDLFLSNVADLNFLVIHGGADENVPTWHSRELTGIVKAWRQDANISYLEEPGMPHWYSDVFLSTRVSEFLSSVLEDTNSSSQPAGTFTLTVATPSDSGSLHGFAIRELETPGRLAKLKVSHVDGWVVVRTTNVHTFSANLSPRQKIIVDSIKLLHESKTSTVWIRRAADSWLLLSDQPQIRPTGPLSQILRSPSSLRLVVPTGNQHAFSVAKRFANAMLLYFRIDTEIMTDVEALKKSDQLNTGDIVIVGLNNTFGRMIVQGGPTPVQLRQNGFAIHGKEWSDPSLGLLFLHPHPFAPERTVLFICGSDNSGLERAARLFLPVRTGITLPELLIIGKEADSLGVGGLYGGGFFNRTWGASTMIWFT